MSSSYPARKNGTARSVKARTATSVVNRAPALQILRGDRWIKRLASNDRGSPRKAVALIIKNVTDTFEYVHARLFLDSKDNPEGYYSGRTDNSQDKEIMWIL